MHLSTERGSMRWGGLTPDDFEEPCEPPAPKEHGVQHAKEDVSVVQGQALHSTIVSTHVNGLWSHFCCGRQSLDGIRVEEGSFLPVESTSALHFEFTAFSPGIGMEVQCHNGGLASLGQCE